MICVFDLQVKSKNKKKIWPFCRVRCGYCDFNTYTQSDMPGVSHQDYASLAMRELDFAESALDKGGYGLVG